MPRLDVARVYVLVRTDLPLHQQIIQVAHAAFTSGSRLGCPAYHHLVLCAVPSQLDLVRECDEIGQMGVQATLFFEPDEDIGFTALCTEAVTDPTTQRAMRGYPMWKEKAKE